MEAVASFLLMVSEERMLKVVSRLGTFKLEERTKELREKYPGNEAEEGEAMESFIVKLKEEECSKAYLILKDTFNGFLHLKTSFLTRSSNTIDILSTLS